MSENSDPNNQIEKDIKKEDDNKNNNKLNISFSQTNNSNNNSKRKNSNQIIEVDKEKEIKIKKSLTKGKILGGQFIIGEEIGKGTFGVVRIATHIITGEKVAVKMLYKSKIKEDSDKKRLEREIKILKILRHRNIVQLYNCIQTSSTIYLVMEHIKGKELFEIIVQKKRLSELESLRYFQQLISGIEYLGKIHVAHRDLKPENLLIDSKNNLKIADFGLSNMYKSNELLSTACGSPCYAAPEMLMGEKYFGLSSDIWSSGIILYTMLCGRLPFEDKNNDILYQKIKEGNFTTPDFLSDSAKDFLHKILTVDPKKRYTILQIKKHPWFNQLDQRKYMTKGLLLNKFVVPIDEDIINKMENEYEYNSKEIRLNLLRNKHNHITTTYYLILNKKIRNGISSICNMASSEFYNYIHNTKNLLSSYNWDWNRILKERGLLKKIEKTSTFKSNSSNSNSNKNENKNKNEINDVININVNEKEEAKNNKNDIDENNILFNNKSEDFLIEKNDIKNDKKENNVNNDNNNNEIKTQFAFENKNNGFKEKIDEIYKQKIQNNSNLNTQKNSIDNNDNKDTKENKDSSSNINTNTININKKDDNTITISNENDKEKDLDNNKDNIKDKESDDNLAKKNFKKCKDEKIISIDLEKINRKNYTPNTENEVEQSTNTNIYVNTISFSNNSNKKNNIGSLNHNKLDSDGNKKNIGNIPKFKRKNIKNSKSAEKGNNIKNKNKTILININKINLDKKYDYKYNLFLKEEKTKNKTANNTKIGNSKNKNNNFENRTSTNSKVFVSKKNLKKNNSSKIINYVDNKYKRMNNNNNINNINKNNNVSRVKDNKFNKFKSANKNKVKIDKNSNNFNSSCTNSKVSSINVNKISNKIIPSFVINKNKVSYYQNTNYSKKISIEGIYYAHKKNLQEINKIYNKISYQTKYKKSDSSIKKFQKA